MKIYIPQKAIDGFGGGWTFSRNLKKTLARKVNFMSRWQDADIYFIPGPTLVERNEVIEAKNAGKKIVFRIDNVPRNSRNRNTGTSKLYDFAQLADVVVYQSQWAKNFIQPFIKKDGEVILNGADTDIFKPDGEKIPKDGNPQYLYVRSSRDETKRWEKAWFEFQNIFYQNPEAHLWIVGRFSPENLEYNFDFFGGAEKRYAYLGVMDDPLDMAKIYRSADILLLPYFADACSNVCIEARQSGLDIKYDEVWGGGTFEIMTADKKDLTIEVMANKYLKVFEECLGRGHN